jgi:hypothetical protein
MDIRAESQGICIRWGTYYLAYRTSITGQSGDFGATAYLGYYDVEGRMYGSVCSPTVARTR